MKKLFTNAKKNDTILYIIKKIKKESGNDEMV